MIIELHVWENTGAPRDMRFSAARQEFDLGVKVYHGATPREAVDELLDALEGPNGELDNLQSKGIVMPKDTERGGR